MHPEAPADSELVQRARAGDPRAFHVLVDRHGPGLYKTALMMTSNDADAQDVVQETLLAAYQALPRFEGRSTFRTWIIGILIRQNALLHRKRKSRGKTTSLDGPDAEPVADRSPGGNWVERTDAKLDLADLLDALDPEQREIIVLRELEGMSYDEMAIALNIPRGTVESRLFRARQAMKAMKKPGVDRE